MKFIRISVNPAQMSGVPCIRGIRIPVATVIGMVAEGMSQEEILKAYPDWRARTSRKPCISQLKLFANENYL